ncbi:MAG TPA: ABC transporter substrate-binding protein [Telmatospirillum sp.]|nr:ABC transporter substrate-binding protein [Telmatospirillum sp.]
MTQAVRNDRQPQKDATEKNGGESIVPLLRDGAVNVCAFIPCPLKVRFKKMFEDYVATYNATARQPLYCPNILEGGHHSIADDLRNGRGEADLPDVIVTAHTDMVLTEPFKSRLLPFYEAATNPLSMALMPESYQVASSKHNIGFLAFGSWSVIRDGSIEPDLPNPTCWADLTKEIYRDRIAITRYRDSAGASIVLKFLAETKGIEAVRAFARNVKAAKHFSEIIKSIDSSDPGRAPLNLLANVAAMQIPSRKNAAMLEFDDAPMSMPILILVKKGRREDSKGALDFFWSDAFRDDVLAKGEYFTPDRVDWNRPYFQADWDELMSRGYEATFDLLTAEFSKVSPAFCHRG